MKIGLHAAMLERRFPNPIDALTRAAALGAESYEIDLGIGRPGEPWAARFESFRQLAPTLRETAARANIDLSSLCLGTLWQTSLASADPGERMQGVRLIRDVCALAQPLGAAVLLLPIGQPDGVEGAAARANAVMSLRECLAAAEDTGVTLALENVCQPFLSTAEEMLEVITDLDSEKCGVYYDLGNPGFIGRDPVAELRLVAPHLVRVHAKDTVNLRRERPPLPETPITGDFFVWQRRTTVTLGTGEVDLEGCARVLHEIGYAAGVVIEVPQPPEGAEAGCRDNLEAARRIFSA